MHKTEEGSKEQWALADGVIFAIGTRGPDGIRDSRLLRFNPVYEETLDFRVLDLLESIVCGDQIEDTEGVLLPLIERGYLVADLSTGYCAVLAERIEQLDAPRGALLGVLAETGFQSIYRIILRSHAHRRRFLHHLGALPTCPAVTLQRVSIVGDVSVTTGASVLCLGDSGALSVALAVRGYHVVVAEPDTYEARLLSQVALDCEVGVQVLDWDIRDPVPERLSEEFDVVVAEPIAADLCLSFQLSRALSLCRAGARVYITVHEARLSFLYGLQDDMGFDVLRVHCALTQYYTYRLENGPYEMSWVEIQPRHTMRLPWGREAHGPATAIFNEELFRRPRTSTTRFFNIDEPRLAQPMYLEMLIAPLEKHLGFSFDHQRIIAGDHWSVLYLGMHRGFLKICADVEQGTIAVELFPFSRSIELIVRQVIGHVYKARIERTSQGRTAWHQDLVIE